MSDEVTGVSVATWSSNKTSSDADDSWLAGVDAATVAKSMALFSVVLLAVLGNGLVVAAVVSHRRLRSVTNQFVVSLAVADLTVAVLVMPVSALFELRAGQSHFTWQFCYFWISCDVTCCTAYSVPPSYHLSLAGKHVPPLHAPALRPASRAGPMRNPSYHLCAR